MGPPNIIKRINQHYNHYAKLDPDIDIYCLAIVRVHIATLWAQTMHQHFATSQSEHTLLYPTFRNSDRDSQLYDSYELLSTIQKQRNGKRSLAQGPPDSHWLIDTYKNGSNGLLELTGASTMQQPGLRKITLQLIR
jgi:hypothetical protein